MSPLLQIDLSKRSDGQVVLHCTRPDGSRVWQKQSGARAGFFPMHDLTHFAIESILQLKQGFYGLLAAGWSLDDFEAPGAAARMPADALIAEFLTGCFDQERASGARWTSEQLNEWGRSFLSKSGRAQVWRDLSEQELSQIRRALHKLLERWQELAPGESLKLQFG